MTPVLAALVVIGLVVWYWANRVDRLNRRVDRARSSLRQQLTRRAAAMLDLALSHALDPASSIVLAATARRALELPVEDVAARAAAESELSEAARAALGEADDVAELRSSGAEELVAQLGRTWYRAVLARRFYNEAVNQARRLRRRRGVRWFRLAGRTPEPVTFEIDDGWPDALGAAP
jgi:hypothetical protein